MDVSKKWIPLAEFYGIFLDFVEQPKKMEGPYCLKGKISMLKKAEIQLKSIKLKLCFLGQ